MSTTTFERGDRVTIQVSCRGGGSRKMDGTVTGSSESGGTVYVNVSQNPNRPDIKVRSPERVKSR